MMSNASTLIVIRFHLSSKNSIHSRRYLKDFSISEPGILAAIVSLRTIMVFNIEKLKQTFNMDDRYLKHYIYTYLQIITAVTVFAVQGDIIVWQQTKINLSFLPMAFWQQCKHFYQRFFIHHKYYIPFIKGLNYLP